MRVSMAVHTSLLYTGPSQSKYRQIGCSHRIAGYRATICMGLAVRSAARVEGVRAKGISTP